MEIILQEMFFEDYENIKENLQTDFDDFWNKDILKSELENENSQYIVAKINGEIVGFAGIYLASDVAEIMNIVVKKTERKKGIGIKLLDKLIKIAQSENKEIINLEVNEKNNAAINMYKKIGFEKISVRKNYYNGVENAIIMQKKFKIGTIL